MMIATAIGWEHPIGSIYVTVSPASVVQGGVCAVCGGDLVRLLQDVWRDIPGDTRKLCGWCNWDHWHPRSSP